MVVFLPWAIVVRVGSPLIVNPLSIVHLMSKERAASPVSLFQEFIQAGLYKRSQGRVARQVTFAILAMTVGLGCWKLHESLSVYVEGSNALIVYGIPGLLLLIGLWISFRGVNVARFADFLIAVEAEMNKVTWPTRLELWRSSIVVIVVIFFMAALLFTFDLVWAYLFKATGILQ